jgi:hypothetical protein
LAAVFADTGLWPLAWSPDYLDPDEQPNLRGHGDVDAVDALDAAAVVTAHWRLTHSAGRQPGLLSPRLAPTARMPARPMCAQQRVAPLREPPPLTDRALDHRLMLVPCNRPADAFAILDPRIESPVSPAGISAVLRSWEERLDAVLIAMNEFECTFKVGAPPTTEEQALLLGAEMQVILPTDDWSGADWPRNVVPMLLHGTPTQRGPHDAWITTDVWRLAPYDD